MKMTRTWELEEYQLFIMTKQVYQFIHSENYDYQVHHFDASKSITQKIKIKNIYKFIYFKITYSSYCNIIFFHLILKEIPFLLLRYNCVINYTFSLTHLYKERAVFSNMSENTVKCTECGNTFKFLKNLRAHIKKKHPLTNIDSIAPTKKIKNKELYVFSCSECEKSFCHIKNLNKHKLIAHSIDVKNEIEHKTKSCYIKNCGSIDNDHSNKTFIYYKYHRNGNYISKGTGLRHLKTQGSNKINGHCPSRIDVTIYKLSNICTVKFIANHLGHGNDLGHLPLNKDVRINIANEIRDNISNNSLERIHLLTRKDLHNIQTSYNLNNKAILHANDAISIESWVQNLKKDDEFSPIYYKQQDEIVQQFSNLKKDDFLLIIMNNYQQSMLEKYGHDVICIDETHGMNSYHFNLTIQLVLDDMREGFPCAFMISNRIDEAVLTIFHSKIKSLTGQLQPNVFMSDMAESFFNACT
ncbi:hypothetical protein AGLY_011583 [Aphis glycines]|uniref:C2H2-type domain-containing protein n=1 Tax=Aphis glycines TaxID=307491 RepID=A0A6G0TBX9_APHGL|nr:hypothetical protein AGLY_011583 [Aphis glycines]